MICGAFFIWLLIRRLCRKNAANRGFTPRIFGARLDGKSWLLVNGRAKALKMRFVA